MKELREMTELEKMQIALFMVIRNSRVLPVGIVKEKSMQEINKMSYETMQECIKMINFDTAVKYYQEGKQLCEAMETVQKWSDENSEPLAKWEINSDGYYPYCSDCGFEPKKISLYCPNCGKKMINFQELEE